MMAMKFKDNELSLEDETVQKALKNQREVSILKRYRNELEVIEKFIGRSLKKMKDLSKLYDYEPLILSIEEEEKDSLEQFKEEIEARVKASGGGMTLLIQEINQRNGNFT